MIAEPEWQGRGLPEYGALLNEVNKNLLLFRHLNLDIIDMATTGVVFLVGGNDSFSGIPCVDDFDDHVMGWRGDASHRIVREFVAFNVSIVGK